MHSNLQPNLSNYRVAQAWVERQHVHSLSLSLSLPVSLFLYLSIYLSISLSLSLSLSRFPIYISSLSVHRSACSFAYAGMCRMPPINKTSETTPSKAFRAGFWMCRFGAKSPKRSRLWSNSRGIAAFQDPRPLTAAEKRRTVTLVRRHIDPQGKKRFTGKKDSLKASGCLCTSFGLYMADVVCL